MVSGRTPAPAPDSTSSANPPRRLHRGPAIAIAMVVLVVTTVAAAWFSTGVIAPGPPAPQAIAEAAAVQSQTMPPQGPVRAAPRGAAPRLEARAPARPAAKSGLAPAMAAPSAAPAAPPRKPEVDEILVIPIPKAGEERVFGAADQGVAPPVLISPRLNVPLQPENGADNLSAIDIVVSDAGEVESVKLASPVRDYREAMMLSAVKAWRFKPASIEGLRVRYLLRIHISVTSVAAGNR